MLNTETLLELIPRAALTSSWNLDQWNGSQLFAVRCETVVGTRILEL